TVVPFKALLVAGTAALMLRAGHNPGQRLWVPALVTALAVLAISARVFLQPAVVSYLFLATTLWLLELPRLQAATGAAGSLAVWVGFLLLSRLHARAIPFLAVVAGPVTALNFLDYAARNQAVFAGPRFGRFAVLGRALSVVAGVLLLAGAVSGRVQATSRV